MPASYSFNPKKLRSRPLGGKTFYYSPRLGSMIGYEPWFTNWLNSALTSDTVFLDIGAAVGYYVVLTAGRVLSVVAVEPDPGPRALLWENIHRNGFTNVEVIEHPLFSRVVRANLGHGHQLRLSPKGRLETTTLDALNLAPTIVKIDAEGAEYDILVGGKKTLRRYAPTLLVEVHFQKLQRYGHKGKHVYELLQNMGYKITELAEWGDDRGIRAEKGGH